MTQAGQQYDRRKHPTLRRGAKGEAVVRLQKRLVVHLNDLNEQRFVDGFFGPGTEREVRRFQKNGALSIDGVVGRNTWSVLLQPKQDKVFSPVGSTASTSDRQQARDQSQSRNQSGGGALAQRIIRSMKRKGYSFFDDAKNYHLNIVGIRSASSDINHFDDKMVIVYRDDSGQMQALEYPITTDPGEYFTRSELLNKAGAAILVPGQYRDTYRIDKHRKAYDALCQRGGTVTVWRDGNRDDQLDRSGKTYTGYYGINIHRASRRGTTAVVGRYSAGCQVFANADNFATFMGLARKSAAIRGNKFTYTLINESDLI